MKEIFQTLVQEEKEKFKFFVVQIYILYMYATVCPRGLYPIYILIYNTKWVKSSLTYNKVESVILSGRIWTFFCYDGYMVNSNKKIIIFPRLHQIHFFSIAIDLANIIKIIDCSGCEYNSAIVFHFLRSPNPIFNNLVLEHLEFMCKE